MNEPSGLLLDTDVLAEVRQPRPHPAVVDFLQRRRHLGIYISALSVAELHVLGNRDNGGADDGGAWLGELTSRFAGFILPVDLRVALAWAPMAGHVQVSAVDSLVAATAVQHCLTIVSRNVDGYRKLAVPAIDPWQVGQFAEDRA
ncbi:plasmid stability protein [Arthrobacter crystallopoietes BAB-32]|uniref:Plasmid stability protein n=1 Tax=Arthrobacter crystallopoietes BAB-32 TaxID=1246476 RepID=N1V434_9MICC|nr:PIN domain-containing protein [Arthrobacter crystallopoietes]EMY34807.1 plasmid stability protein [Arthrobacter crystallopoietes BAB-32]